MIRAIDSTHFWLICDSCNFTTAVRAENSWVAYQQAKHAGWTITSTDRCGGPYDTTEETSAARRRR